MSRDEFVAAFSPETAYTLSQPVNKPTGPYRVNTLKVLVGKPYLFVRNGHEVGYGFVDRIESYFVDRNHSSYAILRPPIAVELLEAACRERSS